MDVWMGAAMLAVNVLGWIIVLLLRGKQEAKELGALTQKVADLHDEIHNGLSSELRLVEQRLREVEICVAAFGKHKGGGAPHLPP